MCITEKDSVRALVQNATGFPGTQVGMRMDVTNSPVYLSPIFSSPHARVPHSMCKQWYFLFSLIR